MDDTKILIAEDETIIAMGLGQILNRMGFSNILFASSGEEVVKKARQESPDLILMDIRLQGNTDGIDAANLIQDIIKIPVIYITATTDEDTLERATTTKPFGFILKPFKEREVYSNIKIALYKHQVEKELTENQQLFFNTFMSLCDAIAVVDIKGRIRFINPMAEYLLSLKEIEVLGKEFHTVVRIFDEQRNLFSESIVPTVIEKGRIITYTEPLYLISNNDKETPISCSAALISQEKEGIRGVVILIRDNSEQRKLIEELRQNALSDELTGLPNRRFIIEYIRQCLARMARQKDYLFAVLYLDLDGFKMVNDNFGHAVGDEVLKAAGKSLMSSVRPTDTVSRLGGDEYLLLLDNIKSSDCAKLVCERILEKFSESLRIQQTDITVSPSIGICIGNPQLDHETIINYADNAMYSVKTSGKSDYAVFGEPSGNGQR